jgi:hypothetical protein
MNGQTGVYNISLSITGNLPLSQTFTFFFVFTVNGPGYYPRIFYTVPGADNGPGNFMFELGNNTNNFYGYSSGPSFGNGRYSVTYGKTMMLSMQANSSSNVVKINGGTYDTASVTSAFTFSNYNFGYGYVGEMLYYNTTLGSSNTQIIESYLASKWGLVSSLPSSHLHFTQPAGLPSVVPTLVKVMTGANPPVVTIGNATLGTDYTVTTYNGCTFVNFLATGKTMTLTIGNSSASTSWLVIGGGGGGGFNCGGGGGAGGVLSNAAYTLTVGTYNIVIGSGGAGTTSASAAGSNGGNTQFGNIANAVGGGGGGSTNPAGSVSVVGQSGGSGGGGATYGTGNVAGAAGGSGTAGPPIQGYAGAAGQVLGSGAAGGGGGGATSAGSNASGTTGGSGGNGITYNNGTSLQYAGGGSAGGDSIGAAAVFRGGQGAAQANGVAGAGATNSGSGGGGGGTNSPSGGGAGGSGFVSVSFDSIAIFAGIRVTGLQIYSVYNGGARGGNYTISYSDDNTNFTAAFSGNVSTTGCGIVLGTGTGNGSYGYHHYWRFVMTGATNLHFPRASRIDLLTGSTIYNLITFASDNCSDSGNIPGLDYATTITTYF